MVSWTGFVGAPASTVNSILGIDMSMTESMAELESRSVNRESRSARPIEVLFALGVEEFGPNPSLAENTASV